VLKKKLVLSRYSDQITQFTVLQYAADRVSYLKYNITPPGPKFPAPRMEMALVCTPRPFYKRKKNISNDIRRQIKISN